MSEINRTTGNWIYPNYDNIKKIDESDKKLQVFINKKFDIEPFHYLSVIKMNSTYLEISDRPYSFYGLLSFLFYSLYFLFCFVPPLALIRWFIIEYSKGYLSFDISNIILLVIYITGWSFVFFKIIYKYVYSFEIKRAYYLPIRLNRRNRKVYIYTKSSEIKIYAWDELFFYMTTVDWLYGIKKMELRAAKVDEEDNIEFSFSLNSPTPFETDIKQCLSYWEFLRQYMEEGPQNFYIDPNSLDSFNESKLSFCNDIDQKFESYETSKLRIFYNYKPLGIVDMIFVAPIYYPWVWMRRYLLKYHAKIPFWSDEVNQECQIESDDPYVVDASINKYFEIKNFPSRVVVKKEYLK